MMPAVSLQAGPRRHTARSSYQSPLPLLVAARLGHHRRILCYTSQSNGATLQWLAPQRTLLALGINYCRCGFLRIVRDESAFAVAEERLSQLSAALVFGAWRFQGCLDFAGVPASAPGTPDVSCISRAACPGETFRPEAG